MLTFSTNTRTLNYSSLFDNVKILILVFFLLFAWLRACSLKLSNLGCCFNLAISLDLPLLALVSLVVFVDFTTLSSHRFDVFLFGRLTFLNNKDLNYLISFDV
jgi:hypothetical protein